MTCTPETLRHTPTPWTLTPKPHASWIGKIGNNAGDPQLWSVETDYPKGDKLADAELIVAAVNSHERLTARVAELEGALRDLLQNGALVAVEGCDCKTCSPVVRARTALSVADGGRG